MNNLLAQFEKNELVKKEYPAFSVGDTVKVYYKISEGGKERTQLLEGLVIERKGTGIRETFTIRRIASGVGVERTFQTASPKIEKITLEKQGHVRQAKLHYIREKVGKAAKIEEKKD